MQETSTPGTYSVALPVEDLAIAVYEIEIVANKSNFESQTDSINIIVEEMTLFELPFFGKIKLSTVMVYGGGIVLPVVVFASVVVYKQVTMPYDLKIINGAIRIIQKGETFDMEGLKFPTREAAVAQAVREDFEISGILLETDIPDEGT